jgi:hypothetical protein
VQVDADPAVLGEAKHHVRAPEGGGEGVRDSLLAAIPAGVSFGHAEGKVRGSDRGEDVFEVVLVHGGELRFALEELIEGGVGVGGRTHGVVVAG